jgi:hypothetical protein
MLLLTLVPAAVGAPATAQRSQCGQSADLVLPNREPRARRDAGELISGLYLAGGPAASSRHCRTEASSPGTITVTSEGRTIATRSLAAGGLAKIRLNPGAYMITGTFADATSEGRPITTRPQRVRIPVDRIIREDVVANIK